jgi:EAL domain-containing protein (putative c-di-GMP-specific phosphodiesterase class I)
VNLSVRQLEEPDAASSILAIVQRAGLDPRRLQLELVESLLVDAFGRQPQALRQLADAGIRIAIDDFGTGYSNFAYLPTLPVRALKLAGQFCVRDDEADDEADDETVAGPATAAHAAVDAATIAVAVAAAAGSPAVDVPGVDLPGLDGLGADGSGAGGSGVGGSATARHAGLEAMDQMIEGIVAIAHRLGHTVTAESVETHTQAARMLALGADLGQGHLFGRPMCADKMAAALAMPAGLAAAGGPAAAFGSTGQAAVAVVPPARDGRCRHATQFPHQ